MSNIVIIGEHNNTEAYRVATHLQKQCVKVHFMALHEFTEGAFSSWCPNSEHGTLSLNKCVLPFEKIIAVYWQNANPCNALIPREVMSALSPFFHYKGCRWVNSYDAVSYHQNKPRQLAHAKQLGAVIPDTFIGNCVESAMAFLVRNHRSVIKPVQGGLLTQVLQSEDTNERILRQLLTGGPVTLQQRVDGEHIRTFVIGQHVLSAKIHSDQLDYRSDKQATTSEFFLSRWATELARRICRGFGMAWCAIDWKYDDGQLYFLEANPCPYFARFEDTTSYPISACLTNLLLDVRAFS